MTLSGNIVNCPVCYGKNLRPVAILENTKLKKCTKCGLIANFYHAGCRPKEYYQDKYDNLYQSYYRDFRNKQYEAFFNNIKDVDFPGRRLLDIGCSYGFFLNKAKTFGWHPVGLEPSEKIFKTVLSGLPYETYNYGILDIDKLSDKFDFIAMWNVFEHLDDPNSVLSKIHNKLNDKGVVLLCVPNSGGLITMFSFIVYWLSFGCIKNQLITLYQLDNDYPHLFHYNKNNLGILLRNNKFSPFFFKGQDIVDEDNIDERMHDHSFNNIVFKKIAKFLLKNLLIVSRWLKREDEIVVMARKA